MRIVYMGTPEIAAVCLREILQRKMQVVGVYTKEDKPVGRKQIITPPIVKTQAQKHGLPVLQPSSLRTEDAAKQLAYFKPDLVVVVAYGLILPKDVLAVPKYGCINLHVSLLPSYRGAAPIQWAIIDGKEKTGLSIMQMDQGLDTGPVLAKEEFAIKENDTAEDVFAVSAAVGANLLANTIEAIGKGGLLPMPQTGPASLAPMLTKEMARLCFSQTAAKLHNLARGCYPWPLAWFMYEDKKIKVQKTAVSTLKSGKIGQILSISPLTVACGQGALCLLQVVPQGAKSMTGQEWAKGRRFEVGQILPQPVDVVV